MPSISRNFLILLLASAANATPVPLVTTSATTETSCSLPNGFLIYPGQQEVFQENFSCLIYECTVEDGLVTIVGDCPPPTCVDARYLTFDSCCLECPNGQNCRLPNGEILNGTGEIEIGGMSCKCPEVDEEIGPQEDRHVTAVCEPLPSLTSIIFDATYTDTTTDTDTQTVSTPEPQCHMPDGTVLYPGEQGVDRRDSHSCVYYICSAESQLEIVTFYCSPPMCVDAQYFNFNSCCRHCPKGHNCRLPNGEILEASEVRVIEGMSCKCPEADYNAGPQENRHILAQCQPLPTTLETFTDTTTDASDLLMDLETGTTAETVSESLTACHVPSGGVLYPGQHTVRRVNDFSCTFYMCHSEYHLESSVAFCLPPMCVDPVYFFFDSCCGHCPDGQNCFLPNGDILKGTGSLEIDGMSCKCPEVDMVAGPRLNRHIEAQCQPLSSTLVTDINTISDALPVTTAITDIGTATQDDFTTNTPCQTPDGTVVYPDQQIMERNDISSCTYYFCSQGKQLLKSINNCPTPSCEDARYFSPDSCCPECPNEFKQYASPDLITTDLPSTVA